MRANSFSRSIDPVSLVALAICRARSLCTTLPHPAGPLSSSLGGRGDRHGLVVQLAKPGLGVWRNLTIRIEAKPQCIRTEFRSYRLDFVDGALAHQQTPADAADQNGKAWVAMLRIKSAAGLARRIGGAGGETIQVSAHQLRRPALRDVAGEGHRALVAIDRQYSAHDRGIGPLQVVDLDGKQQCGAGQPFRFVRPEIALVEIERRLAIELIEDIARGSRHLPAGSEQVPSAGAAMADPDGAAIEADAGNDAGARRAIGPDQRLLEVGAVAGQSPGQRNVRADGFADPGYQ